MWQVIAVIASLLLAGCEVTNRSYVNSAKLSGPESCAAPSEENDVVAPSPEARALQQEKGRFRSLLLKGHCISKGTGAVLRYVVWTSGIPYKTDTERYVQLTMSLSSLPSNTHETKTYSARDIELYFSESGPWYSQGYGWYGQRGSGELTLSRTDANSLLVRGDIEIDIQHAADGRKLKRRVSLHHSFFEAAHEDLIKCLGKSPMCPAN